MRYPEDPPVGVDVPDELAPELLAGERVLWVGAPDAARWFDLNDAIPTTILVGLVVVLAPQFLVSALRDGPTVGLLFMFGILAAAGYAGIGRVLVKRSRMLRTRDR